MAQRYHILCAFSFKSTEYCKQFFAFFYVILVAFNFFMVVFKIVLLNFGDVCLSFYTIIIVYPRLKVKIIISAMAQKIKWAQNIDFTTLLL